MEFPCNFMQAFLRDNFNGSFGSWRIDRSAFSGCCVTRSICVVFTRITSNHSDNRTHIDSSSGEPFRGGANCAIPVSGNC